MLLPEAMIFPLTAPNPMFNVDPEYKVIAEELSEPLPVVRVELLARLMLLAPRLLLPLCNVALAEILMLESRVEEVPTSPLRILF